MDIWRAGHHLFYVLLAGTALPGVKCGSFGSGEWERSAEELMRVHKCLCKKKGKGSAKSRSSEEFGVETALKRV